MAQCGTPPVGGLRLLLWTQSILCSKKCLSLEFLTSLPGSPISLPLNLISHLPTIGYHLIIINISRDKTAKTTHVLTCLFAFFPFFLLVFSGRISHFNPHHRICSNFFFPSPIHKVPFTPSSTRWQSLFTTEDASANQGLAHLVHYGGLRQW